MCAHMLIVQQRFGEQVDVEVPYHGCSKLSQELQQ